MTKLAEIQEAIQRLAPSEQQALRHWLDEQAEETPEMLAAIDEGLASLKQKGTTTPTRAELETKVRRWSGVSH
jgi:hypothetical protein